MRSLSFLVAVPLLAIGAPVAAQDILFAPGTGGDVTPYTYDREEYPISDDAGDIENIANKMSEPAMQDGIATAVEQVTSAMMRLPVGRFVAAIENARPGTIDRRIRRNATIGDLAGHDAEDLPERLGDGSRQMVGMMGGFARAMASMMPEFERMGRELEDSFREARAEATRK